MLIPKVKANIGAEGAEGAKGAIIGVEGAKKVVVSSNFASDGVTSQASAYALSALLAEMNASVRDKQVHTIPCDRE